ncbi:MAG: UDP-N-acetylmuramate--L-alanine ligase [Candidatus Gracilibacteria bacterium]
MHLHIIGIGGIGVSALARFYRRSLGWHVTGSDASDFSFRERLESEGIDVSIGHSAEVITSDTDLVIYSEAIITKPDLSYAENLEAIPELKRAKELGIRSLSYPQALSEIFDERQGIAVTGSHGKSTTTAMIGVMLQNTPKASSVIVGTQVPQFGQSNFWNAESSSYFTIEACEYKRSFLAYHPYITVITNIDLDHLDYYKNLDDYFSAFDSIIRQTRGYVVMRWDDERSKELYHRIYGGINTAGLPIPVMVGEGKIVTIVNGEMKFEDLPSSWNLQVPGDHLEHDAELAYAVGRILGLDSMILISGLESYQGSWRRSEVVGETKNRNILMSDYGHHPEEIKPTLKAIKQKYSARKLFVVFQPHQYSRTRELLSEFATSFDDADELMIPNIYFSRDKAEDVEYMTMDRLITLLQSRYPGVQNGQGLEETARYIEYYDHSFPNSSVILLLGAGDVDSLREDIPVKILTIEG